MCRISHVIVNVCLPQSFFWGTLTGRCPLFGSFQYHTGLKKRSVLLLFELPVQVRRNLSERDIAKDRSWIRWACAAAHWQWGIRPNKKTLVQPSSNPPNTLLVQGKPFPLLIVVGRPGRWHFFGQFGFEENEFGFNLFCSLIEEAANLLLWGIGGENPQQWPLGFAWALGQKEGTYGF